MYQNIIKRLELHLLNIEEAQKKSNTDFGLGTIKAANLALTEAQYLVKDIIDDHVIAQIFQGKIQPKQALSKLINILKEKGEMNENTQNISPSNNIVNLQLCSGK